MKNSKKQRLESKGYVVGDFADILGLSSEEKEYVEFKLYLSNSLRKNRERKELTQERFARLIKSSQSRVAKMESCDPSVSIDLLIKSHVELGVSIKELMEGFDNQSTEGQFEISTPVTASSAELNVRTRRAYIPSSSEDDLTSLH